MTPPLGPGPLVWLASYPKSGNTWMRVLLAHYRGDGTEELDLTTPESAGISSHRPHFDELLGIPSSDLTDDEVEVLRPDVFRALAAEADDAVLVKVHDAHQPTPAGPPLIPPEVTRAAVYLVRDPRDVAVSAAFHSGHHDLDRSIRRLGNPEHQLAGGARRQLRQRLGTWSSHVRGWTGSGLPLTVVRYEDLVADTAGQLERVVTAIGWRAADHDACLARAVERSSFARLRAAEDEHGFRERHRRQQRFFRSGTVGDWRNHLSDAQAARVVADHGAVMAELGYHDREPGWDGPEPDRMQG